MYDYNICAFKNYVNNILIILLKNIKNIFRKLILLTVFACFFVNYPAFSYQKRPIADKLWVELDSQDKENLRKISILLESEKYDQALISAGRLQKNYKEAGEDEQNPFFVNKTTLVSALENIILWRKYSDYAKKEGFDDKISFNDISRFVEDNKFYPNLEELQKKAENVAKNDKIPYRLSEQYFISNPAIELSSKLYLIEASQEFLLQFSGSDEEKNKIAAKIQNMITDVFVNGDFDEVQEKEFLQKYGDNLTPLNYQARINRLLWDSKIIDARRILSQVDKDHQALFNAIIDVRSLPKYIKNSVVDVPRKLRKDENLTYSRILWHKTRDETDEVVDLILDVEESIYPQNWWGIRRLYGRELLKTKDYKESYQILSKHGLSPKDKDYWEAEWTSGFVALRFLNKPKIAYEHFINLFNNVKQPVTISRAAYWLGMSALAMGDKNKAIEWYKVGANYPLYFYGQLAIHKHRLLDGVNNAQDIILPKEPDITVADARKIASLNSAKVAYLLTLMGDRQNATKVFEYAVLNSQNDGEIAVLMRIVNEVGDREMEAKISRTATKKNVFFIHDKFQIVKEVQDSEYSPLIHAIIKQESGFAVSAKSSAGAIGFMQIMPDTAKNVARSLGIGYSRWKLQNDVSYNIKLGSHYIKQMVDRFDGSEVLAIASYNAGPHNAQRWIDEFYDPRKEKDIDKVVDWIELITYSETRNYVQRITENLIVYRYLMSKNKNNEL